MRAPGAGQRRRSVSLLWLIFAVNAALFATPVALLALTPASVHSDTRPSEVVMLVVSLVVLLGVDFVLVRRALAPLRRLVDVMAAVDPMQPGRRAEAEDAPREISVLSSAFNEMLDRVETERRDSARRALSAQERERLRVARELHDEVGQSLTAIALRAGYAAEHPATANEALTEISSLVQDSLESVGRVAQELRPDTLDDLGLVNALIALCSRSSRWDGPRVQRELGGHLPPLAPEVELVIYRVAQEALTNALRHSGASRVTISLQATEERVQLTVRDRGAGLPSDQPEGNGLRGMRERAVLIGAELRIESSAGDGVLITLTVPLGEPGE
jgi:two-component system sensor histidine kinase UhpB